MTIFPGPYLYPPAPCDVILAGHEFFVGAAPPGSHWVCVQGAGQAPGALVYATPLVVATYLVQCVHFRGSTQDVAVTTHHWRWEGAGAVTDTDMLAVDTRLTGFWEAVKTYISTAITSREYRWYGPRTEPGLWGEAIRVTPIATSLGTATAGLPHQVSCAVTETTDVRRRWGRFYIPSLAVSTLDATNAGTFTTTFTNAVGAAANTLLGTDVGEFAPVVFGTPSPTSLAIRGVRVDRIPDIQRRRRSAPLAGYITTFS